MVRLLVAKGANVNSKDNFGETPLFNSLTFDKPDIAQFLLEKGALVGVKNAKGETPLHMAVGCNGGDEESVKLVRLLLAKGADVNAASNAGETPLQRAIAKGRSQACQGRSES